MTGFSLQDGIDQAGSPINLLWKANAPTISVPVVPPEYSGWVEEQSAWQDRAILFDQCHHMTDLFIDGPDALRLLERTCANDLEKFAIGQAKQMIPVTPDGNIITDVILLRTAANSFVMTGVPSAMTWVAYHAERAGYNVSMVWDPDSAHRAGGAPPVLFRYQIQGARAMEIIERALGGPAPAIRFFHSAEVSVGGRKVRAFRHGMLGQPGFELLGEWRDHDAVLEALLEAGKPSGMVRSGGLAYYINSIESGWIPTPTPGIYSDPGLDDYRRYVPLHSFEGQMPIHGSFFSEDIADYYVTPYELGYGRLISSNHDFIGREALDRRKNLVQRTKVTLRFDGDDVRRLFDGDPGYLNRHVRDRIEIDGELVGLAMQEANLPAHGTILALGLIDKRYATPGTQVDVVWGEHPGPGTPSDAHRDFPRLRATVEPTPYSPFARTQYRR